MSASLPVQFPSETIKDAATYAAKYFEALRDATTRIDVQAIAKAAKLLSEVYDRGGRVWAIGNGGSASLADHLMCDHLKGGRTGTNRRPQVCSLASNNAMITAIGNDIAFEQIFTYQLESLAKPGDCVFAISCSGNSPNIVAALEWAKREKVSSISLTGFAGGKAHELADVGIHTPVENYGVSEDINQSVMHILAQFLRMEKLTTPVPLPETKF